MPYTYSVLTGSKATAGSIRNWLNYDKVPADLVLEEAQALIYARLRVREMRSSTTVTLALGASSAALPAGFLDPIDFRQNSGIPIEGPLFEADLEALRAYDDAGVMADADPAYYAIFDEAFQFNGKADEQKTLRLLFYKTPAFLGAGLEANFLTSRYPTLLRVGCLAAAADYRKDMASYQKWLARMEGEALLVQRENDMSRSGMYLPTETI